MSAVLALIVKFWPEALTAALIFGIGGFMYAQDLEIRHYKGEYAADQTALAKIAAEGKAQAAAATKTNQENARYATTLQSKLDTEIKTHSDDAAAATERLRVALGARFRSCTVPGALDPATGGNGSEADAAGEQRFERIVAIAARLPSECQLIIDQLGTLQTWAAHQGVKR